MKILIVVFLVACFNGGPSSAADTCSADPHAAGCGVDHGAYTVAFLRAAVPEDQLRMLNDLADRVKANGPKHLVRQPRNFGLNKTYNGGHEVTYLHEHATQHEIELLWRLALQADASMPNWGIAKTIQDSSWKAASKPMPTLRCLEIIEYFSGEDIKNEKDDSLGWHYDGATLFTQAIALVTAGIDFDGGELQLQRVAALGKEEQVETIADLRRGDLVAWRGWDLHRVQPVTQGRRQVIVAEWWLGPSAKESQDPRPEDTLEITRDTLEFAQDSAYMNRFFVSLVRKTATDPRDFALAAVTADKAVALDPSDGDSHFELGQIHLQFNKIEEAVLALKKSIEINPTLAEAHAALGSVLASMGNTEAAEDHATQALLHKPELSDALLLQGLLRKTRNDMEGAIESFREVLRVEPANAKAQNKLGGLYLHLGLNAQKDGDDTTAEDMLRKAVKFDPKQTTAYSILSTVFAKTGFLEKAVKAAGKSIKLSPTGRDAIVAYKILSYALHELGNEKGAKKAAKSARKLEGHG